MEQVLKSYLEYICGVENVAENIPLSLYTTFKIGGPARFFVTPKTKECFVRLVSALKFIEQSFYILGMGANVLASDRGTNRVVIRPSFREIVDNQCFIYADAGASLASLCKAARERNLGGLEWAAGIPATVGGAVFMNAGAHGAEIKNVVAMVDALYDGKIVTLDNRQLKFEYRKSIFHKHRDWIILGAYFDLSPSDKDSIFLKEKQFLAARAITQPNQPSAGSIFKNPTPTFHVGAEIEKLGLKGYQIGGAQVSPKHANFIINTGNATAADVLALIKLIRRKIYAKHKIRLQTEIQILE